MSRISLRARFDDAAQFRGHLRYTKHTPVLLLPRVDVEPGTRVQLEVELLRGPHYLTLEGTAAATGRQGTILSVPDVAPLHGKTPWVRNERRFPLDAGAVASASGLHARVQVCDVSFGGARIDSGYAVGTELELRLRDDFTALRARVTWMNAEGCGLRWVRTHAPTRLSALRLLQRAVAGWDRIPLISHQAACASCMLPSVSATHSV